MNTITTSLQRAFSVSDICDTHPNDVRIFPNIYSSFGNITFCHSLIETVYINTDNSILISLLARSGDGKVAVVNANGNPTSAVVGDRLARIAVNNKWNGIILNGCVRDTVILKTLPLCVFATGVYPMRGARTGGGEVGCELILHDISVRSGEFIYADEDGIIITDNKL